MNFLKYNRRGSPFYSAFENIIILWPLPAIAYNFAVDVMWGFLALICGGLWFVIFGRRFVMRRLRRRILEYALSDLSNWWTLWKAGDLSIRQGEDFAYSPRDYWIDFILYPEKRQLIRKGEKCMTDVFWTGGSGREYVFALHPINTKFNAVGACYIIYEIGSQEQMECNIYWGNA